LESLAKQLSIAFFVEPHESGSELYNVDHSTAVLLLDPAGQFFGVFPAPHEAEKMAHDVVELIQ
jgi:cytochrome oxidase Cu insertion factor (SCO1/SenC/PrrC family)